ncbi:MAG TPA: carboxypeptidase-like regulatory domain-containing protein [Candidatus Lokiarchaeia archaeon]|nr:carboxypeptidase-like regulatory domain-containing protein [Candidatus Lokiarchaeia archaeon]
MIHAKHANIIFSGLLIAATIVAGMYCGMFNMGMPGSHGNMNSSVSTNQGVMTSQAAPPVSNWSKVNYAKLMVYSQEAPPQGASRSVPGVKVPVLSLNETFYPKLSTNATSTQPVLRLRYSEDLFVNCTDASTISNFTIRYVPSLANDSYDTVQFTELKNSGTANYSRTYTQINNTELIIPDIHNANMFIFRYEINAFYFNVSEAVHVFENNSLYTGARFIIQLNYSYPISIVGWSMKTTSSAFDIEGKQSAHTISYSESFTVKCLNEVNLTFYFIPVDQNVTFDYLFYKQDFNVKNSVLTRFSQAPSYNTTVHGWKIEPAPFSHVTANSNGTLIAVTFNISATVGFTEIAANRWTLDKLVASSDMRMRQYQLSVLQGPETYLIENIRFKITDMYFGNIFSNSNASYPDGSFYVAYNTYQMFNPVLEAVVSMPNGTQGILGRIQKSQGPVTVSFEYDAPYSVTFRVLDAGRNPLPGAEVVLNYSGLSFGSLMAWNTSIVYPPSITDSGGLISCNYLPEGNYTVVVNYQGTLVQAINFTLDSTNSPLTLEIITTVQPWYNPSFSTAIVIIAVTGGAAGIVAFVSHNMYRKRVAIKAPINKKKVTSTYADNHDATALKRERLFRVSPPVSGESKTTTFPESPKITVGMLSQEVWQKINMLNIPEEIMDEVVEELKMMPPAERIDYLNHVFKGGEPFDNTL